MEITSRMDHVFVALNETTEVNVTDDHIAVNAFKVGVEFMYVLCWFHKTLSTTNQIAESIACIKRNDISGYGQIELMVFIEGAASHNVARNCTAKKKLQASFHVTLEVRACYLNYCVVNQRSLQA